MSPRSALVSSLFSALAMAQTAPPAPVPVAPAAGASLVQPITLQWNAVVPPSGSIGSYSWEIGTTSAFATIIAAGFTDVSDLPAPTQDKVSGLPNGTYFWHVKATAIVGGVVFALDSPWSPTISFAVTGLGAAPPAPAFLAPATGASFHPLEFFDIRWSAVPGAHHYLLEADDQATFSYPLTLTTSPVQFGTTFHAGWGNPLPDVFYRVRAVSADGVKSLPSATLDVHITDLAPVPPAPTPLFPINGATVSIPFTFDWTDTPNPQILGYDIDIDNDPLFQGPIGVAFVPGVSRSDYMIAEGLTTPGTYFWRVRALHGDVFGPWSAGQSFTLAAPPPTPPGLSVFSIVAEPSAVSGGNPTQARVTLNMPAPAGGVQVAIASDMPFAQVPSSVLIPAGATDAIVSPITTVPVNGATVGDVRAAYAGLWQQSSLGLWQILWGHSLGNDIVIGGSPVTGTVTLLNPAPPGGVTVSLFTSDAKLATVPPTLFVPAGATGGTFNVTTAAVAVPTRVTLDSGTGFEGYHAPQNSLVLMPAGSPAPAPSLASLALAVPSVLGGGPGTTGTVTLTSPAPAGGATVRLSASMEGTVIAPQSVTVPAGALSADFALTAPEVNAPRFVLVQGTFGASGATAAKLLEIDPAAAGAPVLFAMGLSPTGVIAGSPTSVTVELVMPAPAGGGVVALSSDNPAAAQVPATVTVPAGNSAATFPIATSASLSIATTVGISATAGGVARTQFLNLSPNPASALALLSVTLNAAAVTGGTSVPGTVTLNATAPPGGVTVTLSTSNLVASPPPIVLVPAGASSAGFSVATSAVTANTLVTITGIFGAASKSASLTVQPPAAPPPTLAAPTLQSPAVDAQPAQPVTFSWSSVTGAASYELQIDDSNVFTLPLTQSLTSTTPQATTSGLPSTRLFWRVRAKNAAGTAGAWSAARRFQPLAAPAAATLTAVNASPSSLTGGAPAQGTVTLSTVAPAGGALVTLGSSNAAATLPASVTVAAGSASATFPIATTAVTASTPVTITASFGGLVRTMLLTVAAPAVPDVTPPTVALTGPLAGAVVSGTATLTATAADNVGVVRVDFLVDGVLLASDATAPYTAAWNTATAANGAHSLTSRAFDAANNSALSAAVAVTVDNGAPPVTTLALTGMPATVARGQTFPATAAVSNGGGTAASGLSVAISFTPSTSMRLSSPQVATQSVPAVPAAGLQNVTWQLRADNAGVATVTMTLRSAAGALLATQSLPITITN